jgi:hypothetical protein
LLKSQLGDTEANSTSLPKHCVNVRILGKAGVCQDQRSHNPIYPVRNVHVVLPQHGMITRPNPCTVIHRSKRKNYQSRLILQQNGSEIKNYYFNASLCLKSCLTESIVTFCGSPIFMMNHQQQKRQTVWSYRNCEDSSPPCSLHGSHLLSSDFEIKYCFPRI